MSWLQDLFKPSGSPDYTNLQQSLPTNLLQYDPSNIASTQASMLGGIGGLGQYNVYGNLLPQAQGIGQGMVNDPNALSYLSGAGGAAGLGMNAALNQYGAGGSIYGTAFDPQRDLYNRTLSQVTDAARANAMAAGLGTTPVGVGATDWATNQFNIDWQNQQLQRQIAGSQAASGLQGGAAPLFMQSAAYPYQASQGIGQNQLGTLANLGQFGLSAAQIPGQQIQGWQQALGLMGGLQNQAFNQQQGVFGDQMSIYNARDRQAQQNFQNMMTGMEDIGKFAGSMFGMPSFGGGGWGSGFNPGGGSFGGAGATGNWVTTPGLSPFQQIGGLFGWGRQA